MTSVRVWGPGVGAVVVLVATGAWARGSTGVDAGLWAEVRPAIEARLVARAQGTGAGESEPELRARWFCRADALQLTETGTDGVRAGVDTTCEEYGVRGGALVLCGGSHYPQVVRLERDPDGGAYRVVSQQEPPDGADYAAWVNTNVGHYETPDDPTALETTARTHFALPANAPVTDC